MAWIISLISKCAPIYYNAHHVLYQDRINRHLWYMTYFVLWNVKRASLWPGLIQFKFFFFCHYGLSCESQVFSIGAISKRHRHYSLPPTLRLPLCHICHLFSVTFCQIFVSKLCNSTTLVVISPAPFSAFIFLIWPDPTIFISLCHVCVCYRVMSALSMSATRRPLGDHLVTTTRSLVDH